MKRLLKKAMRDLFKDKRRAAFSLLAILIGTMSYGIVTFTYHIIPREIRGAYDAIVPESASIIVDRIDDRLIELTESFDGIAAFEERAFYNLRVRIGKNRWKSLELYSAGRFDELQINKIANVQGAIQPGMGEALIERDAVQVAAAGLGDALTIVFLDGTARELVITGVVADIALHPASMHDTVYAYVSHDTLRDLGLASNKIDFIITGEQYDSERILTIGNEYIRMLEQSGYAVESFNMSSTPGISMHMEEYEGGLFLLQMFSFVSFILGCMIMCSLILSIISAQTRQIGILKSIGASTGKITASYMLVFFAIIACATAISIILSTLLAGSLSSALMSLGNMVPADMTVSLRLYLIYCGLALAIPLIIAYFPIWRGTSISVKNAINDYGASRDRQVPTLRKLKFLSRPVLLSLRNAVRKKRRFILNIAILSFAGALFVSTVASMISMQTSITENLNRWKYDYMFVSSTAYADSELAEMLAEVPNVSGYENWGQSRGLLLSESGDITNSYSIQSPPAGSAMIAPDIMEGRWIAAGDTNQIAVSHSFFVDKPGYGIGDALTMQIGGTINEFIIIGSVKDFGMTTIFMSESGYEQYVPAESRLSCVRLSLEMTTRENRQNAVYRAVEAALGEQGALILQTKSKAELNAVVTEHYAVTMQTFMFIICLIMVVSGFGLVATMNTQASERIKEIGVMKAMGASEKQLTKIISAESIFIALISWGVAVVLGIPLGLLSVDIFGAFVLDTPLRFNALSLLASYAAWLLLTLIIGYLASRACAKRAARMSIRSSLAYE